MADHDQDECIEYEPPKELFVRRYFIWDTESTGLKPTEEDVISLGGVLASFDPKIRKFILIEKFHTYVETNKPIDKASEAVHHITKAMLRDQPKFPEAVSILRTFLRQYQPEKNAELVMIAHNGTAFDEIILYSNFVQHRLDFDRFLADVRCFGFADSLKMFKQMLKNCSYQVQPKDHTTGRTNYTLGDCHQSFCGYKLEGAHDALADSEGLFRILNSETISSRLSKPLLCSFVTNLEKSVKRIRQKAGSHFQAREERTRLMSADADADMDADGNHDKANQDLPTEPIFRQAPEDVNSSVYTCLNCITFVPISSNASHTCA